MLTDNELLEYVVEKDFEDSVGRVILAAVDECTRKRNGVGKHTMASLVRGRQPHIFRTLSFGYRTQDWWARDHFGRLQMLDMDQTMDFVESLLRQGLIDQHLVEGPDYQKCIITEKGKKALKGRNPIPCSIPWPMPRRELTPARRTADGSTE